ncbi:MAG: patatin-like phospholipase family protein [Alphaproteobacteria bacterium]|nr:patatin-like phospholipase family protein [Alphaproteobacteria bacterium]
MQRKTRDDHLFSSGPKRILSLDGGGIRGILTVQILARIEEILRARAGEDADFRLADYFDLIGGTSTGAILAAGLATGRSVAELDQLYRGLGEHVFQNDLFRQGIFRAKFSADHLREVLENEFKDTSLGDESVRTGLAIVAKRLDTGSPWVVHNNPRGRYFAARPGGSAVPNADYLVKDVVRASTAAPTYFDPEKISVTADLEGAFVDGGVSPHNNPALQLLLLATLEGYGLQWPLGADNILLVSIGTGAWELKLDPDKVMKMTAANLGLRGLASLMDDAAAFNELVLQWLSASATARPIDREVGDLKGDVLGGGAPWLTYLRYNAQLDRDWLKDEAKLELSAKQVEALREMDDPKNMPLLIQVGEAVAGTVKEGDLEARFDIDVQ